MGTHQQFCLRWNNHQSNMLNVFDHLLQSETLVDVTLACEGLSLRAHKVVLSACSPYFQTLFAENPCNHPIVILKDINYSELRALVNFMYKGEVNVSQDRLPSLLKTAEHLKVKGLSEVTQNHTGDSETTVTASRPPQPPWNRVETLPISSTPPPLEPLHPQSPGAPKRKRARHRKASDSMSGGGSDYDENETIHLRGSPEILEARVDLPEHLEDMRPEDSPQQPPPEDPVHPQSYAPTSPVDTKERAIAQSPRQQEENGDNFPNEPSYPPHDAGVMVASLPSTSAIQNNQGAFLLSRRALAYAPQRCRLCHKVISNIYNFRKHMKVHSPVQLRFECHLCLRVYNREDNLRWHLRTKHGMQLHRKPRRSSSEGPQSAPPQLAQLPQPTPPLPPLQQLPQPPLQISQHSPQPPSQLPPLPPPLQMPHHMPDHPQPTPLANSAPASPQQQQQSRPYLLSMAPE